MWFRSSVDPRVGFVCQKNGGTEPNRTLGFTPESKHLRVIGNIIPGREKKTYPLMEIKRAWEILDQ